jgi:enoyl-CoA hydratase
LLLYQLHDRARDAGIKGYRRMSKAQLAEALEIDLGESRQQSRRPSLSPPADIPAVPAAAGPTEVDVARRNGFAIVTLRGHDNALGLDTLERLAAVCEELAADTEVRLIAITGAGQRIFSAGADLASMQGLSGADVTARGTDVCRRIAALPVPTLALLNGHAVGGAIDLVLACDWRIAAQGAKLRFIHNELGYSPPWGAAARLGDLVGRHVALRLFATCEVLPVEEARGLGLVDEVVAPQKLIARVESLASRVARSDREALAVTKRLLSGRDDLLTHEREFARLWESKATIPV